MQLTELQQEPGVLTARTWPETPQTEVMDALRFLLRDSLTEAPRGREQARADNLNDLGWAFVAGPDFRPVAVRTYAGLGKKMNARAVYFTLNTFYSRRRKTADALRRLNALWVTWTTRR